MNNGIRKKQKNPVQEKSWRERCCTGVWLLVSSSCVVSGKDKFSQTMCKFIMYKHQNQDVNSKTFLSYQLVCLLEVRYKNFLIFWDLFDQMNLNKFFGGKEKKKRNQYPYFKNL